MNDSIAQSVSKVDALLPQLQCQRCGYPSCGEFAEAVVRGLEDRRGADEQRRVRVHAQRHDLSCKVT